MDASHDQAPATVARMATAVTGKHGGMSTSTEGSDDVVLDEPDLRITIHRDDRATSVTVTFGSSTTPDPEHPVLPALGPSDDPDAEGSRPPAELLSRPAPDEQAPSA